MVNAPRFDSLQEMDASEWLNLAKKQMADQTWPSECRRCQEIEQTGEQSIRLYSILLHETRKRDDYLQIGGVLDNVCNSACQFCSSKVSTKIAALEGNKFRVNNYDRFLQLPLDRIEHLDINGGEPSNSKNYAHLLSNLPPNLQTLRVNTNGSRVINELEAINKSGVAVTVTMSFDGIDAVHDYVRWPVKWENFYRSLMQYREFKLADLNLWTTVNALNVGDLCNIRKFVQEHDLHHSYALLDMPYVLNVRYSNVFTKSAKKILEASHESEMNRLAELVAVDKDNSVELRTFIDRQDTLRNITIKDYINVSI